MLRFLVLNEVGERVMAREILRVLIPKQVDNSLPCGKLLGVIFALITLVSLFRSLVHMFSADGGAGSIAGLNMAVSGAEGIIFAFGLWGSSQLILALLQLLVLIQYRSLIPLMILLVILEVLFRMLIGAIKPVYFASTPPGAIGNWVMLGLGVIMLAWCIFAGIKNG